MKNGRDFAAAHGFIVGMKTPLPFLAGILALTFNLSGSLRAADAPIDVERAKELFRRSQAGETLSTDEQKYLDEAKRQREAQQGGAMPDRERMRAIKEIGEVCFNSADFREGRTAFMEKRTPRFLGR